MLQTLLFITFHKLLKFAGFLFCLFFFFLSFLFSLFLFFLKGGGGGGGGGKKEIEKKMCPKNIFKIFMHFNEM